MKLKTLFLFAILLKTISISAQKLDIDKISFKSKRTLMPLKPQGDDVYFYQVNLKNSSTVRESVGDADIKSKINISGLSQVEGQSNSVIVNLSFSDFMIDKNEITSRTEETKDKAGVVTKKTYYKIKLTYNLSGYYDVKGPKNNFISESINIIKNYPRYFESSEYGNQNDARNYYRDNALAIRNQLILDLVNDATGVISRYLSAEVGYRAQNVVDHLWMNDSKKHPDFEENQKMCKLVIDEFARFTYESVPENFETNIAPAVAYFKKLANGDMEDKSVKKSTFLANYNLGIINFYLDDLLEAKQYADKLIKAELYEKDAKVIIENINEVTPIFKANSKATTHFKRETQAPDQTLIPKSAGTSAVNQIAAKLEVPRFLPATVIDMQDKEIDGMVFNEFTDRPWEVQDGIRFIPGNLFNDGKFDKKSVEKYSPKELKAYTVNNKVYLLTTYSDISKLVNGNPFGATAKKLWLEVVVNGKYKILNYYEAPASVSLVSGKDWDKEKVPDAEPTALFLLPGEEKAKVMTTYNLEEAIEKTPALFKRYEAGEFSIDQKPVKTKRDMLDRLSAKASLSKNIDLEKLFKELNK
jgi:hypothetical protein